MVLNMIDGNMLKDMFLNAANNLEKHKEMINSLNVYPVPDGDTGTNMSLTMSSAVKKLNDYEEKNIKIKEVIDIVTKGSLMGARGNSGVILSQIIRGFGKGLEGKKEIDVKSLSFAFRESTETAYRAVMKPTEGTILTVAKGCSDMAYELSRSETNIVEFLRKIIQSGKETLAKTPEMLSVLKEAGVVDAGGKGYIIILEGMLLALVGEKIDSNFSSDKRVSERNIVIDKDIEFGYCTEFIINDTKSDSEQLKEELKNMGDSMLVIGEDNIIKVHIHTNNPGEVIEKALKCGELIDIKIDNMRYQHSNNNFSEFKEEVIEDEKIKKYGLISVSIGEGLNEVFTELGVDKIISGGQTMNPSTEDIIKAIDSINAENIIIFPNNSNIILAANQAKLISEKSVEVIPTKSIQAGISSLFAFDPESDIKENIENMKKICENLKTGQITFSVKDTSINGTKIKKGDIIGLVGKEIVYTGSNIEEVTLKVIDNIVASEDSMITIIYGKDIDKESAKKIEKITESKYSSLDIELIYGGQPLYHYLISAE